MNFFQKCINVEQVKTLFRELAKKFHPDLGGNVRDMQLLNDEYFRVLKSFHKAKSIRDGKEVFYYYNEELEKELADVIYRVLGLKMPNTVVSLVGLWLWVEGETRPHKESLKAMGLRWQGKRTAWYYHNPKLRSKYNPNISLDGLKSVYGCEEMNGPGMSHIKR